MTRFFTLLRLLSSREGSKQAFPSREGGKLPLPQ